MTRLLTLLLPFLFLTVVRGKDGDNNDDNDGGQNNKGGTSGPQVQIQGTTVVGSTNPLNTEFFGGMPFAKAPVGNLRFTAPQLVTTLPGKTFNATAFGPSCIQPGGTNIAEDCLSVNVFRPAGLNSNSKLPVMAWIYGGGFADGSSSLYNATFIVARSVARGTPIVYVSLNYRVGPLGFPTGSEAQSKNALNLGLKDQITALKWIQANIEAFGGDRSKVTVFGESAGAISIADLFLNSNLESVARAAILESGSQATTAFTLPATGTPLWDAFVEAVPTCAGADLTDTFACLRAAPVSEINNADAVITKGAFDFVPVVDGPNGLVPDFPSKLLPAGKFTKIPFITGTNLDEGTLFTSTTINSSAALDASLVTQIATLGTDVTLAQVFAEDLLALYPDDPADGSPFGTGNQTFGLPAEFKRAAAITGDVAFQSLRRAWINAAASNGVKTFGYLFTEPQTVALAPGVSHGSEVGYVYGAQVLGGTSSPGFQTLSAQMMDYWISFATSLTPNDGKGSTRLTWPQFTPTNQVLLQLNSANLTVIPDTYRSDQITFINLLPSLFGH